MGLSIKNLFILVSEGLFIFSFLFIWDAAFFAWGMENQKSHFLHPFFWFIQAAFILFAGGVLRLIIVCVSRISHWYWLISFIAILPCTLAFMDGSNGFYGMYAAARMVMLIPVVDLWCLWKYQRRFAKTA